MNFQLTLLTAFTDNLFGGNSAAVCPLDHWLNDQLMQKHCRRK
jgi:predicted PhzF superfamily epimerase YddE/YHI9